MLASVNSATTRGRARAPTTPAHTRLTRNYSTRKPCSHHGNILIFSSFSIMLGPLHLVCSHCLFFHALPWHVSGINFAIVFDRSHFAVSHASLTETSLFECNHWQPRRSVQPIQPTVVPSKPSLSYGLRAAPTKHRLALRHVLIAIDCHFATGFRCALFSVARRSTIVFSRDCASVPRSLRGRYMSHGKQANDKSLAPHERATAPRRWCSPTRQDDDDWRAILQRSAAR